MEPVQNQQFWRLSVQKCMMNFVHRKMNSETLFCNCHFYQGKSILFDSQKCGCILHLFLPFSFFNYMLIKVQVTRLTSHQWQWGKKNPFIWYFRCFTSSRAPGCKTTSKFWMSGGGTAGHQIQLFVPTYSRLIAGHFQMQMLDYFHPVSCFYLQVSLQKEVMIHAGKSNPF